MKKNQVIFFEAEKVLVMSTSRGLTLSKNEVVPRYVLTNVSKTSRILDYGCGKDALHVQILRREGFDVEGHDFHCENILALEDDFDVVYASNVLNIQCNERMMLSTLEEIVACVKKGGLFIANYPSNKRLLPVTTDRLFSLVEGIFGSKPTRVGGSKMAPLFTVIRA